MPQPNVLSGIKRGDYVVLKRYLNKKGEISPKARVGSVRKTGSDGQSEVVWSGKSDKKQSYRSKQHTSDTLHRIDRKQAVKVSQFLHKHIATKSAQPAEPSVTPDVSDVQSPSPPVE